MLPRQFLSALALLALNAGATPCLSYSLDPKELSGVVEKRVFPGPPNYQNIGQGDRPHEVLILKLAAPICMDGRTALGPMDVDVSDVRELQLIFPPELWEQSRGLVGHQHSFHGSLMHRQNAQHYTTVVLVVASIGQLSNQPLHPDALTRAGERRR